MSTPILPSLRESLASQLRTTSEKYCRDLSHLPAEKLGESAGGAARSPLAFTAEVAGFNYLIAKMVRGETVAIPSAEERAAYEATVHDLESATSAVQGSVEEMIATMEAADDAQLATEITAPWGSQIRPIGLLNIAVTHMAYHDGQINFIQTLLGDTDEHYG